MRPKNNFSKCPLDPVISRSKDFSPKPQDEIDWCKIFRILDQFFVPFLALFCNFFVIHLFSLSAKSSFISWAREFFNLYSLSLNFVWSSKLSLILSLSPLSFDLTQLLSFSKISTLFPDLSRWSLTCA